MAERIQRGQGWNTLREQEGLCAKGVHSKTVAGISGSVREGAYSIVLSGGYRDDKDEGDFFIYTGTGGQEDTFAGGGGPQVADQTFEHKDNAALLKSAETKRPVRVVRGVNVQSKYAPPSGYRYDGLYVVERAYMGKNADGYQFASMSFDAFLANRHSH
ncbi:PUA-like domain-containing protein [Pholiota molesta]|nr:PUA-like domain-containing protein [Pholiota molesta]